MTMEENLFQRYKETGDLAIRNEIAEKYLYVADILAKKFAGRGVEYDDLRQVAALALVKGIDRFDPDLGMQFATFITPTITGEIKNYFRDRSRLVKYPRKLTQLAQDVRRKSEEILSETGRKPSVPELAEALSVEEEAIVRAMEVGGVVSFDSKVKGDDDDRESALYDVIPDRHDYFEEFEQNESLHSAMGDLSDTEKMLLKYRYTEELSQAETAKRLGVSQMFVSRMERKVLGKLRERLGNE
ncbi:MAG: sigma-70 family RNA polymerase sigma factor [Christensenellaceae bacterium]